MGWGKDALWLDVEKERRGVPSQWWKRRERMTIFHVESSSPVIRKEVVHAAFKHMERLIDFVCASVTKSHNFSFYFVLFGPIVTFLWQDDKRRNITSTWRR